MSVRLVPTIFFSVILAFASVPVENHNMMSTIKKVSVKKWLFLVYISFVLLITIFGRNVTVSPLSCRFENFWPIGNQEIENILLFLPLSFLFLITYSPQKPWKCGTLFSLFLSCAIEICQVLTRLGLFQYSDIVFNTLGGCVGCICFAVYNLFMKIIHKK